VAQAAVPDKQKAWRELAPVIKYLKAHFTHLASTLNVLEKDILVDFVINSAVTLKRVKAQNYKVRHPSIDKDKNFVFEFENFGENTIYTLVPLGSAATSLKGILTENQMQCRATPVEGNKSVKF